MLEADSGHPWLVLAYQGGTLPRHCSPQLCRLYLFQSLIGVLLESQRQEIKVRNRVSLDSQGQEIQVAYSLEVIKY